LDDELDVDPSLEVVLLIKIGALMELVKVKLYDELDVDAGRGVAGRVDAGRVDARRVVDVLMLDVILEVVKVKLYDGIVMWMLDVVLQVALMLDVLMLDVLWTC
jgi:hypothetical protein